MAKAENKKKQTKEEKGGAWFSVLYSVFAGVVIILALLLLASRFEIPGIPQVFVVQSGSMEPVIHTGSIVAVSKDQTYEVGDVITFTLRNNELPVTHRITRMEEVGRTTRIYTKGDANENEDPEYITSRQVIGTVLFDVPWIGYAVAAARQPIGFFFIIILPAGLIIIDELVNIGKEIKRLRSTKKK